MPVLEVHLRALGCEVATAVDGQDALSVVQKQAPSLMLLDLNMPRLGGMELLRTLRQAGADFPGNVRELANVIEQAVVLGQAPMVTAHDLPPRVVAAEPRAQATRLSYWEGVDASKRELVRKALSQT